VQRKHYLRIYTLILTMSFPTYEELVNFVTENKDDEKYCEKLRSKFPDNFSDEDIITYMNKLQREASMQRLMDYAEEYEAKQRKDEAKQRKDDVRARITAIVSSLLEMKEEIRPVVNMLTDMVLDRVRDGRFLSHCLN
jgi:signal recognition particle GTPase